MASLAAENDIETGAEIRDWFTVAELAELDLPGLPDDRRSINRRARDERWALRHGAGGEMLARPRTGRGGGTEFHVSLLPGAARLELARRGLTDDRPEPAEAERPEAAAWRWYEGQSGKVKAEAERRAAIVAEFDLLVESGLTRSAAVAEISRRHRKSGATIWNWLKLVEGIARTDRLPALAPRRKGGGREAEIDAQLWHLFLSDWMRLEAPTLGSCYARIVLVARERGLSVPSEAAFRRRIKRDLDPRVIRLARGGKEKAERSIPDNRRTLEGLHALDLVNIDGHQFDVFVTPPGGGKPIRPILVAIQDVYSRKVLAWRLDLSENVLVTRLVFADLFQRYGIPNQCLLDNSRTFASKALTAGADTRYRYKIRDEDPAGLLVSVGIQIRFAKIYHGQSKPIERAFRDFADHISRGPECAGAWTGNTVANKPANYGKRAIPWEEFEGIVDRGIAAHNARLGRKAGISRGRSFDEVFAESYASSEIRKATPEQLRMALLAAEQKRIHGRTGEIELYGNRYWAEVCGSHLGEKVTVRFDPDNLHSDVHLYDRDGRFLTTATVVEDFGFTTQAGAKAAGKRKKEALRTMKAGLEAEQLLEAAQVAAQQPAIADADIPETKVVHLVRPTHRIAAAGRGGAQALKQVAEERQQASLETEFRVFDGLSFGGDDE